MNTQVSEIWTAAQTRPWNRRIPVEGELTLPEGAPDIGRVLLTRARVLPPEQAGGELRTTVVFHVLYESEEGCRGADARCACSLELPEEMAACRLAAVASLREASARKTDTRQLQLRCGLELQAVPEGGKSGEIITDIPEEGVYTLKEPCTTGRSLQPGRGGVTLRDELLLPPGLPAIGALLYGEAEPRVDSVAFEQSELLLRGSLGLRIQYATDNPALPLQTVEFSLPWEALTDPGEITPAAQLRPSVWAQELKMRPGEENRSIQIQLPLTLETKGDTLEPLEALADAYGTERTLRTDWEVLRLYAPPAAACQPLTLTAEVSLGSPEPAPLRIEYAWTIPAVETVEQQENKAVVTGLLRTQLLYAAAGEAGLTPLSLEAPFTAEIPLEGLAAEDTLLLWLVPGQTTATLTGADTLSLSISATACSLRWSPVSLTAATASDFEETPPKPLPSFMLALPQKGETPWQLAKRCRVAPGSLEAANPGLAEGIPKGKWLVIFR